MSEEAKCRRASAQFRRVIGHVAKGARVIGKIDQQSSDAVGDLKGGVAYEADSKLSFAWLGQECYQEER